MTSIRCESTTPGEIGPGDSFDYAPVFTNESMQNCYVFASVDFPTFGDEPIYEYTLGSRWKEHSHSGGHYVFAYGDGTMTEVGTSESTEALMNGLTIKSELSLADYKTVVET